MDKKPPIKEFIRMDSETYAAFVRDLPAPIVTSNTTELQAGFQLGVQHVLEKLRSGFVVGGR